MRSRRSPAVEQKGDIVKALTVEAGDVITRFMTEAPNAKGDTGEVVNVCHATITTSDDDYHEDEEYGGTQVIMQAKKYVAVEVAFDDGDTQQVTLAGKGASCWAPYEGGLGYLERSAGVPPRLGEERAFKDRGSLMAQGPFTQSQREVMGEGICTIAMLLDMLGKQRQEHGWLWDELQSPGVLLTGVRMEGMPSVADVVEQQTSHGTVQIAAVCLGLWVPFFPTVLATDISSMPWNSPDQVLDFNSARPLGVQYRLKASSKGGYSPKQFVFCSQADVSKAWMPDEVNSKPRFVLLSRGRPGRFISVPDHKTVVNDLRPCRCCPTREGLAEAATAGHAA